MTQPDSDDLRWLNAAVRYATPYLGTTGDNPASAALVVDPRSGALIARAVTASGGRPHAEALALDHAGLDAAGATLYLTIEPCCNWSRTPPCVDAIVRSGIMRVVIGVLDPHPRHGGQSVARLESAGIEVVLANHASSAALHAGYSQGLRTGHPLVTVVMTVAADGALTDPSGVSGEWLDLQRTRSDALMLGAASVRARNLSPAVQLPGYARRTPLRVVLSGAAGLDRSLNLIGGFSGYRTAIIAENSVSVDAPVSVDVLRVEGRAGRPDLAAALTALGARGVRNLLVEPGPRLAAALLEADLVDTFAVITTDASTPGAPPANADGPIADVLDAAGLLPSPPRELGEDVLTVYRRRA